MIIGVTGGIGCGKSTACKILSEKGYKIIDVDIVAKQMLDIGGICYDEVVKEFGCVAQNGEIDRRALANIVFGDEVALKKLNSIVHPKVHMEMARLLGQIDGDVVIDCALLIESGYVAMCDKVVLLSANKKIRIDRIAQRNKITKKEAKVRIEAQNKDDFRKPFADVVITSNGSEEELKNAIFGALEDMR